MVATQASREAEGLQQPGSTGRDSLAEAASRRAGSRSGVPAGRNSGVGGLAAEMGFGELKRLVALLRQQYEPLLASLKTVCIVGPVNTGKSSLYNALIGPSSPKAVVSPVPGTTRQPLRGDAEAFWVVDTPGANEVVAGAEGPQAARDRHEAAIAAAVQADLLIIVFDAARGIAEDEGRIYGELSGLGKPFVVVLNKIDLVRRGREEVVKAAAASLQLAPEQIIPTSALRRINLDRLLLAILELEPGLLATLAELAPAERWTLANNTVLGSCAAAGTANLITSPIEIPFASFVPITAIQVAMVLKLARVYGLRLSPARAKELVLTLGGAFLGRTLFYQLVDLVPVAGYALGTAVAVATTAALGYAVTAWFAYGERPSEEAMRRLSESLTRALLDSFKRFPSPASLRQGIRTAVADALKRKE